MNPQITKLLYLAAAILFILALKAMASPKTARKGNLLGALGMLLAVVITLLAVGQVSYTWIVSGLIAGTVIGTFLALTVKMTAMPQMVAMFNGFGGLASAAGVLAFIWSVPTGGVDRALALATAVSALIGWVTFTGSLTAFAKLQGLFISGRPLTFRFQTLMNVVLLAAAVGMIVLWGMYPAWRWLIIPLSVLAGGLGVLFVLPIGGADMPVVICLLNSYSGLAAATTGFVFGNEGLIIAGSLVGASGIILTRLMCRAMNRSLANVLFGAVGQVVAGTDSEKRTVRGYTVEDAEMVLSNAALVIIVPGYGLAAAQAQHPVKELTDLLTDRGVTVKFAIHPVAGRMPGHMNVLLAEADVPYEQMFDMEEINSEFERADAALVLGANDVINPAARTDRGCPIYGMPILNVDRARTVIICKRSLGPGFAGIDNELFYAEKTMMIFGDAKATMTSLLTAMKQ